MIPFELRNERVNFPLDIVFYVFTLYIAQVYTRIPSINAY